MRNHEIIVRAYVLIYSCSCVQGFTSNFTKSHSLISEIPHSGGSVVISTNSNSNNYSNLEAWPLSKDPKGVASDYPLRLSRVSITVCSTFLTWWAQKRYSNVLASSAITLIFSICFDKRLGQASFCGTLAGMSSRAVVSSCKSAIGLGILTSVLFEWLIHTRNIFSGIGGRLGATAFIATSICALFAKVSTGVKLLPITAIFRMLNPKTLIFFAFWHALGSVATILLREASDDSTAADPVRASAVIGLIGALLLEDNASALALYGGSFVGMSLPSRLMFGVLPGKARDKYTSIPSTISLITAFGVVGAIGGLLHGASIDLGWWKGGWGGKAGSCSFLGCLIFRGIQKLYSIVGNRFI